MKTEKIVREEIERIPGATFISFGRNGHGPTARFECFGMAWEYGFDSTPKAAYTQAKTRKGILHMMLAKAGNRGLSEKDIYGVIKRGHNAAGLGRQKVSNGAAEGAHH